MIPTCSREMGNLTVPCAPQPVQCISYKHLQHTRPACARMHVCRLITDTSRKAYSDSTSSTNSSSRSNSSRTIAATHLLPSAPSVTSTSCLCLPNVTAVQQLIVLLSANHTSAHEPEATHLKTTFPGVDCLSAPHVYLLTCLRSATSSLCSSAARASFLWDSAASPSRRSTLADSRPSAARASSMPCTCARPKTDNVWLVQRLHAGPHPAYGAWTGMSKDYETPD
eukprot:1140158-Pelagomonas_calceolata.AAC.3